MAEINWDDVDPGIKYKFEDGYYLQAEVIVLSKIIDIADPDYITYKMVVTKPIYNCVKDQILEYSKRISTNYSYLTSKMKFKTVDDDFDYMTPGNKI
jgi:hypothetical protein